MRSLSAVSLGLTAMSLGSMTRVMPRVGQRGAQRLDELAPVDVAAGLECVTRTRRSEIFSVALRGARARRLSIRAANLSTTDLSKVTTSGTSIGWPAASRPA